MRSNKPVNPGINATLEQMCEFWQAMDKYYGEPGYSPLHHDARCKLCLSK